MNLSFSISLDKLAKIALTTAALMMLVAAFSVDILGMDVQNHFIWLRSFPEAVWAGDLRPTWISSAFAGLGAPSFYFYSPLAYYVATPFYPLLRAFDDVTLYVFIALAATLLSFVSFRFFAMERGATSSVASWSALLYAVAPFRVYEFFTRSGLTAQFAVIFIPLLFAAILNLQERRRTRDIGLLAVSYAMLILSNIPALITTSVTLGVYLATQFKRKPRSVLLVATALAIGVMLSAFYLVPIPFLDDHIQRSHLEMNKGELADGIMAMINLTRLYDITESTHSTINVLSALFFAGLLLRYKQRDERPEVTVALICCALVAFFQIKWLSWWVWSFDLLRTVVQFPHRWSIILIFGVAVLFMLGLGGPYRKYVLSMVIVWGFASAGFSALIALDLKVHPRPPIKTPFEPPEYATVYSPPEMQTVIAIAKSHASDPELIPQRALASDETMRVISAAPEKVVIRAKLRDTASVIIHQWRWPFWNMYNTANEMIPVSSDTTGRMIVLIPAGSTNYELRLEKSAPEKWGIYVSLAGLAVLMGYVLVMRRKAGYSHPR